MSTFGRSCASAPGTSKARTSNRTSVLLTGFTVFQFNDWAPNLDDLTLLAEHRRALLRRSLRRLEVDEFAIGIIDEPAVIPLVRIRRLTRKQAKGRRRTTGDIQSPAEIKIIALFFQRIITKMGDNIRYALIDNGENMLLAPWLGPFGAMQRNRHTAVTPEFHHPLEIGRLVLESGIVAVESFGIGAGAISLQLPLPDTVDMPY